MTDRLIGRWHARPSRLCPHEQRRHSLGVISSIVASGLLLLIAIDPAISTETVEAPETASTAPEIDQAALQKQVREQELLALGRDMEVSDQRQSEIEREIQLIDRDRDTLNSKILTAADTIKSLETKLTDTERRLLRLAENEDTVRMSLRGRRGVLAEVLAALQRIGRRPPPALAVRPSDALAAVRSAILLNAVMPELRVETEALAADLAELSRLKSVIAEEKKSLRGDAMRLAEEKSRLELLLSAKRQERDKTAAELAQEKARSQELAAKAGTLKELIADLEREIESARTAAAKSREAERQARLDQSERQDPFSDPGRLAPAVAFEDTKGRLPRPVSGEMVRDFGQEDEFGSLTQGQSITTRAGSRVTSPSDGWVVYAGPFRSFGQLLILNTGGGYHVLLAGMDRIDAELGQFVLAGEPVGVMGTTKWASASTIGLGSSQPILYVEFRKDGSAIDPTPWWVRVEEEKARG
ncbi:murein hydrolase activator EnvC family protein [Roseibium polysiphoniae]|uniref:Peptidoglycan DD-metalloendopeptidase family protein n=1 Tax=Roseibium polysiphoniae TaxID=2571221 RepID=A0ABR9CEZ3_9HYPH|nr:peptidoglycan DD-metalloendopeptidase family protein [Roseibium polysiphoniae]MBD8878455.1 peptidoglycan DD-metalloendopeptidase family protein [Roseibium polysiphoniae]